MGSGRVTVRESATGQTFSVWPVDARELLKSGEYAPVDEAAERIAQGVPVHPLTKGSMHDAAAVKAAHAAQVAEGDRGASGETEALGETDTPKRGRKKE